MDQNLTENEIFNRKAMDCVVSFNLPDAVYISFPVWSDRIDVKWEQQRLKIDLSGTEWRF